MTTREQVESLVGELYASWYPSLLSYAYRSVGSMATAEDLVQDTWLLLCSDLMKGAPIRNPKGWTLTVLRHQIAKRAQRERDRGIEYDSEEIENLAGPAPGGSPAVSLLASDELSHLLSYLTRREEEVVLLRLEGMKYHEIGGQLGLHVSTVKTLIARALRKLQGRRYDERAETDVPYVEPGSSASR